ncbi:DNA cytosine methyltransferase [Iodidimonas sp. SYSU 1G8]|uniref:DNA cytosine methyltransferase n=1 Tax=Iodidimonas sp. SYSU 1G8 TaxID=3133967 RepID=UPI0031FEF83D
MIKGLDIFCGAGGSSAGARAAGIEMRAAIDMDAVATRTYQDNFEGAHVVTSRLEEISLSGLKQHIGQIDLLLASPECTNHTCAKGSAPRSEASRATAMTVVEYARTFRPRWLVLENVVHMRPWSRYGELKRELELLGYNIGEQILNSKDYGVAQSRRRLFIVGDLAQEPKMVSHRRRGRKRSAASILDPDGCWPTTPLRKPGRATDTLARADRAVAALGENTPYLIVYYGTDGSGGWQPLARPLRTVTTVDRFALVTPTDEGPRMRMLQVSELRRAMGFAPSYLFQNGTRRDRIRLLGNGVCPPVMETVIRTLIDGQGQASSAS